MKIKISRNRLSKKAQIQIFDSSGNRLLDVPKALTDDYRIKLPIDIIEIIPSPPPLEERTIETGTCGSFDALLDILKNRIFEEAQILSFELKAEPKNPQKDALFGGEGKEAVQYAI